MYKSLKLDPNRPYMVVTPVSQVRNGYVAGIHINGRTDEMAVTLAEAMVHNPWIRIALVYAVVEYKRLAKEKKLPEDENLKWVADAISVAHMPGQLALFE